jgi:hypothetical protein
MNKLLSILLLKVKISRKSNKEWLQENALKYIGKYLGVEILLTRECTLTFSHYTPDITVIKVQFLYSYSKIVQSEQSIYLKQCSDWLIFLVQMQTYARKCYDSKACWEIQAHGSLKCCYLEGLEAVSLWDESSFKTSEIRCCCKRKFFVFWLAEISKFFTSSKYQMVMWYV